MALVRWWRRLKPDDLNDPYLRVILACFAVLSGFWFWYRVPNFAGGDEYSRLLHPIEGVGYAFADPSFESLQRGLTDGRGLGATFYLYGLVLVPLFVIVVVSGQFGEFTSLAGLESRWDLWHEVPTWFWISGILLGRLVVVVLALGCVVLIYRLGTELRDRNTGRIAAALFAVTFGLVSTAHELGEDIPMLFLYLLASYLVVQYVQTGRTERFLAACVVGGFTIAMKLNGGAIVFVIGAAFLSRTYREKGFQPRAFAQPKLLGYGALLGFMALYVGFPSVLVGGPDELIHRVLNQTGRKGNSTVGGDASIWYWLLEGYLKALGLPLAIGIAGAIVGARWSLLDDAVDSVAFVPLLIGSTVLLTVYSQWEFVRMRHVLPTIPAFLLLLSIGLRSLNLRRPNLSKVILAALLLSSAAFTAAGTVQYATDPRDQATDWMESNVGNNETMEVYRSSVSDVGAVHGQPLQHYPYDEQNATRNASLVQNESAFTEWMTSMPKRSPEYIQLTENEVQYADADTDAAKRYPKRAEFISDLLEGEYEYRVVAEFGERSGDRDGIRGLVGAGTNPKPPQHEDYIVILERTNAST